MKHTIVIKIHLKLLVDRRTTPILLHHSSSAVCIAPAPKSGFLPNLQQ
ncbi:hypothetical protein CEXT_705921, partial [Caerostris extrusa]